MTHSILIVDDDADLCQVMAGQLGLDRQFTVTAVSTIAEATLALLDRNEAEFDAIILDVGLPDGDGIEFCRSLRRAGTTLPIIVLTGIDSDDDLVRGFEAGANDHLMKPFRAAELCARLRVQMRMSERSENASFAVGRYTFRPGKKMLYAKAGQHDIILTEKESSILLYLLRAGAPVSKATLLREVWGYNAHVTTHTLETHMYRLRTKIEPDPRKFSMLTTESGGYRLVSSQAG